MRSLYLRRIHDQYVGELSLRLRITQYDDEMQFEGMNMRFGVADKLSIAAVSTVIFKLGVFHAAGRTWPWLAAS